MQAGPDAHLPQIYDLNNVPLVHGNSHIKWHLPHSIHGEHRGRTGKSPIINHRVEYNYGKVVPVRIAIDKANNLSECPVEFEVLQEFPSGGIGSRDERITLGKLTLNLSEYVEESEAVMRDPGYRPRGPNSTGITGSNSNNIAPSSASQGHARKRSSLSATTSLVNSEGSNEHNNKAPSINEPPEAYVEDGIIRRYLMTDSKINSTLKISILMIQIDGERHYVAPPLKSAPVFGGIAGVTSSSSHPHDPTGEFGQHFLDEPNQNTPSRDDIAAASTNGASSNGKSRDLYELQDMYRRALAASWACQPGELPADECIEDIFAGGDGFGPDGLLDGTGAPQDGDVTPRGHHHHHHHHSRHGHSITSAIRAKMQREDSGSSNNGASGGGDDLFRPREKRAPTPSGKRGHTRQHSGESASTMRIDVARGGDPYLHPPQASHFSAHRPGHRRDSSKDSMRVSLRDTSSGMRSRSESLVSLAATIESERGRSGFKNAREVQESEVRDDLVAWRLPGTTA